MGISRLQQVGRFRAHDKKGKGKEVAMRRRATFLSAETDEVLTWLAASLHELPGLQPLAVRIEKAGRDEGHYLSLARSQCFLM